MYYTLLVSIVLFLLSISIFLILEFNNLFLNNKLDDFKPDNLQTVGVIVFYLASMLALCVLLQLLII